MSSCRIGFLTGKYRRGQPEPEGTRRATLGDIGTVSDVEKAYDIVEVLDEIARNRGVTVAQVALNWLLRQPGITKKGRGQEAEGRRQLCFLSPAL